MALTESRQEKARELYNLLTRKKEIVYEALQGKNLVRAAEEAKSRLEFLNGPGAPATDGSEIRRLEFRVTELGEVIDLLGLRE